jgi:replicative DNA helicase
MAEEGRRRQPPQDRPTGTVTPAAPDVEKAVLSIMIQFQSERAVAVDQLEEDDFFSEMHRTLFRLLAKMYVAREEVDLPLLTDRLMSEGLLEQVGGVAYLNEVAMHEATPYSLEAYAKVLKEKAMTRRLIAIGAWLTEEGYRAGVAAHGFAEVAQEKIFNVVSQQGRREFVLLESVMEDVVEHLTDLVENQHDRAGHVPGVPTGFYDLDERVLGGYRGSDLVIIAARPGMGKTSFALNCMLNAAERGHASVLFSLEMPREQLAMRLLSTRAEVDLSRIWRGTLSHDEWNRVTQAANEMRYLKIIIDDTPALSTTALLSRARRLKLEHDIEMIVVDYLQLMRAVEYKNSREQEISEISRTLKAVAKELKVPVLGISQLNRALEARKDKRPMLSDLRESGAIEQDADVVIFIYRDEKYDEGSKDKGVAEVEVAKHRNGPVDRVRLGWDGRFTRFTNLAEDGGYM